MDAKVTWKGRMAFEGAASRGFTVPLDTLAAQGGDESGFSPMELLLVGLSGCTAMDVISILEKKRQDVRGIELRVEADQRTDEYPKIYTEIRLHFVVTGFGVSPEAVARSIALSEEKYCSVGGMVRPEARIVTSYEVLESDAPGTARAPQR